MNSIKSLLIRMSCATLAATSVAAAQATAPQTPQIVTRGRGEADIIPDRAEIMVQVETRSNDATRAGEMNATATRAVLDTLRRGFGLADRDMGTAGYSLQPQMVYQEGKPPQLSGFVVTNSVRVRTSQIPRLGAMIDAAIRKGGTSVAGPAFYAANADSARRLALAQAVAKAKADAEIAATAAGGRLGPLLELVTEQSDEGAPGPRPMFAMQRVAADTPIQAGEQRVTVVVQGRWAFVAR